MLADNTREFARLDVAAEALAQVAVLLPSTIRIDGSADCREGVVRLILDVTQTNLVGGHWEVKVEVDGGTLKAVFGPVN